MKITSRNRFFTNAFLAAAVTLLAAAPTAQAARAKKQADPAPIVAAEPASPYTLEIGITADSAANDLYKSDTEFYSYKAKVSTYGADLTGVYALDANRAITLRFGFGMGSVDDDVLDGYEHDEWKITRFTLMPGYRYTKDWGNKTQYFIGVNVGLVQQSVELTETINGEDGGSESFSGDSIGLGYSAEIGLTYKYSEKVTLLVAYQLSGSTNRTELDYYDEKLKCEQQMYHTIRAGVSVKF